MSDSLETVVSTVAAGLSLVPPSTDNPVGAEVIAAATAAATVTQPAVAASASTYVGEPTHDIPETVDDLLVKILTWPRKHDSEEEKNFRMWLRNYIMEDLQLNLREHALSTFSVTIPMPKIGDKPVEYSTTLFSCHIDTVDPKMTSPDARKKLDYMADFGVISLAKDSVGGCLGADDGAGIWIMLNMIKAGVPGTYLFHRGEECGGLSAKAIASKEAGWLGRFEAAVAFDRHRTSEIIIRQGGTDCASEKFGGRLADTLTSLGMAYRTSVGGVYTDVKEYRGIIAECVNIGVGYEGQHHTHETLDYSHLVALSKACCMLNWDALPIERDPKAKETYSTGYGYGRSNWMNGSTVNDSLLDDEDEREWQLPFPKSTAGTGKPAGTNKPAPASASSIKFPSLSDEALTMTSDDLLNMIHEYPEDAHIALLGLLRENAKLRADVKQLEIFLGGM